MEKRISLLILSTMFTMMLYSQVSQGTFRIGPEFSYSGNKQEIDGIALDFKDSELRFALTTGYYVIDNLEVGLGLAIYNQKSEIEAFDETQTGFFIGPQIRYMVELTENLYLPISGGIGLNSQTFDDNIDKFTLQGLGFGFGVGIEYLIDHKIGAQLSIGYDLGSLEDLDSSAEVDFSQVDMRIGVNLYF